METMCPGCGSHHNPDTYHTPEGRLERPAAARRHNPKVDYPHMTEDGRAWWYVEWDGERVAAFRDEEDAIEYAIRIKGVVRPR